MQAGGGVEEVQRGAKREDERSKAKGAELVEYYDCHHQAVVSIFYCRLVQVRSSKRQCLSPGTLCTPDSNAADCSMAPLWR